MGKFRDVLKLVAEVKHKAPEPPLPMEEEEEVSTWTNTNTNKDWWQAEQQRQEDAKATTAAANSKRNAWAAARKAMQEETLGETQKREEAVQHLRTTNGKEDRQASEQAYEQARDRAKKAAIDGIDFEFFHETEFSDLEDDGANDDQQADMEDNGGNGDQQADMEDNGGNGDQQVDMDHPLVQQAFDMSQGPSKKFFELCADMHPEVEYYQRKMDE